MTYRWSKQMLEGHGHSTIRLKWIARGDLGEIEMLREVVESATVPKNTSEES